MRRILVVAGCCITWMAVVGFGRAEAEGIMGGGERSFLPAMWVLFGLAYGAAVLIVLLVYILFLAPGDRWRRMAAALGYCAVCVASIAMAGQSAARFPGEPVMLAGTAVVSRASVFMALAYGFPVFHLLFLHPVLVDPKSRLAGPLARFGTAAAVVWGMLLGLAAGLSILFFITATYSLAVGGASVVLGGGVYGIAYNRIVRGTRREDKRQSLRGMAWGFVVTAGVVALLAWLALRSLEPSWVRFPHRDEVRGLWSVCVILGLWLAFWGVGAVLFSHVVSVGPKPRRSSTCPSSEVSLDQQPTGF